MIDKKKAQMQYLQTQLADPNISEYEKQRIRLRLGINPRYSADDFVNKHGFELMRYVSDYIEVQCTIIRREKRTDSPFDFLTPNQKTIAYLCSYSAILEDDSLEQLYDIGCFDEITGLAASFEIIGRKFEAKLVRSILDKKLTPHKIEQLIAHFQDDRKVGHDIETDIEKWIHSHLAELLELQDLCSKDKC